MINKFIRLLAAATALSALTLFAQESPTKAPVETLTLQKKTYPLRHALAYETTIDNEEAIVVLWSRQAVSGEKLKEARESAKEGGDGDFDRPYLKLIFNKTGELNYWSAAAGGHVTRPSKRQRHRRTETTGRSGSSAV